MKKSLSYLILLIALFAGAQRANAAYLIDTTYVFNSWENIMDLWADTTLINTPVEVYGNCDIDIVPDDSKALSMLNNEAVAVMIPDSYWFINSEYLKKNFSGKMRYFDDFMPLFFTPKIAFVQYEDVISFWGDINQYYYIIDFATRKVEKLDRNKLLELLSRYPDLRMRYESMKDNKTDEMITDFFFQYVDRLTEDAGAPYILDYLQNSIQ